MAVIYIDADKCLLCESKKIRFNSKTNEFFCADCGYVLQDSVYHVENRYNREARKVYVSPKKKKIAVIINSMLQTDLEKKMWPFKRELMRFNLSAQFQREILYLCRKAIEKRLTIGNKRETLLAALIYAVAKREGIPIMLSDLERVFGVRKRKILKVYKKVCRALKINQVPQAYCTLISRMASSLMLDAKVETLAIKIADDYKKLIINPKSLAAVSLYAACGIFRIPIGQKECAKVGNICTATLGRNWDKINKKGFDPLEYKKIADEMN